MGSFMKADRKLDRIYELDPVFLKARGISKKNGQVPEFSGNFPSIIHIDQSAFQRTLGTLPKSKALPVASGILRKQNPTAAL